MDPVATKEDLVVAPESEAEMGSIEVIEVSPDPPKTEAMMPSSGKRKSPVGEDLGWVPEQAPSASPREEHAYEETVSEGTRDQVDGPSPEHGCSAMVRPHPEEQGARSWLPFHLPISRDGGGSVKSPSKR